MRGSCRGVFSTCILMHFHEFILQCHWMSNTSKPQYFVLQGDLLGVLKRSMSLMMSYAILICNIPRPRVFSNKGKYLQSQSLSREEKKQLPSMEVLEAST